MCCGCCQLVRSRRCHKHSSHSHTRSAVLLQHACQSPTTATAYQASWTHARQSKCRQGAQDESLQVNTRLTSGRRLNTPNMLTLVRSWQLSAMSVNSPELSCLCDPPPPAAAAAAAANDPPPCTAPSCALALPSPYRSNACSCARRPVASQCRSPSSADSSLAPLLLLLLALPCLLPFGLRALPEGCAHAFAGIAAVSRSLKSSGVADTAALKLVHTQASLGAMGRAPCLHTPRKIWASTAVGSWSQVVTFCCCGKVAGLFLPLLPLRLLEGAAAAAAAARAPLLVLAVVGLPPRVLAAP